MFRILFLSTPGTGVLFKMTDAWRGFSLGFNFCQVYHLFAGFQHGGSPVPLRSFFVMKTFCQVIISDSCFNEWIMWWWQQPRDFWPRDNPLIWLVNHHQTRSLIGWSPQWPGHPMIVHNCNCPSNNPKTNNSEPGARTNARAAPVRCQLLNQT